MWCSTDGNCYIEFVQMKKYIGTMNRDCSDVRVILFVPDATSYSGYNSFDTYTVVHTRDQLEVRSWLSFVLVI